MKSHKMKPQILPKLKFKMMNRQLNSDLPLDLTIDKINQNKSDQIKSIQLFRPYIDCGSSCIKSHQIKSNFPVEETRFEELMIRSLFDPFLSPFMYKLSPSLSLSTPSQYSFSYNQMILSSTPNFLDPIPSPSERSSSNSPTSIISSSTLSSTNSSTSYDFNYRPLESGQQVAIDLSKRMKSEIKVKPKRIRQTNQNQKLMKNTANEILIKCPACWQLFDQENSLRKHIKSKHQINDGSSTFDRIHKCEHCVLAFTRFDMLQRHNRKHTGDKPYECNMCFQNFSRSDHLNTHRINHFGLKMYKCSKCAYASSRRDMVSRHLQTHSNGTDSDAYVQTDLSVKQLCKKLVHSTPDQIPELLGRFRLEC